MVLVPKSHLQRFIWHICDEERSGEVEIFDRTLDQTVEHVDVEVEALIEALVHESDGYQAHQD